MAANCGLGENEHSTPAVALTARLGLYTVKQIPSLPLHVDNRLTIVSCSSGAMMIVWSIRAKITRTVL